jgi:hypothetical protein
MDIKLLREKINNCTLSKSEIADSIGITYTSLYNKLSGIREFKIDEIYKLLKLIDLEFDDLYISVNYSPLIFFDLTKNLKINDFRTQVLKIKEEFKEFKESLEFGEQIKITNELLDLVQACISLYHLQHKDSLEHYDRWSTKIKKRLKNNYDWGKKV